MSNQHMHMPIWHESFPKQPPHMCVCLHAWVGVGKRLVAVARLETVSTSCSSAAVSRPTGRPPAQA